MSIDNDLHITVEAAFHIYCSEKECKSDSKQYLQLEELVLKEISKTKDKYGLREALRYRPFDSFKIEEAIREKEQEFKERVEIK